MDGSGNAVVVWVQGGSGPIKAASRPAGGSFSLAGRRLSHGRQRRSAAGGDRRRGRSGRGVEASTPGRRPRSSTRSVLPGGVFSAPADLSAPNGLANTPQLAMDAAGNAVAVWQARNGIFDQIQAASRKPGAGFSSLEPLSVLGRNAQTPRGGRRAGRLRGRGLGA